MTRADRLEAIAETATRMRDAQRRYFKTRDGAALYDAKRFEERLDAMLDALADLPLAPETSGEEGAPA